MTRFIDLTAEISHGMVRYPSPHLPPVEVVPVATLEVEKRSVMKVTFGTHVSTHFDAPRHAIPGGTTIDCIPLDVFCGKAALVKISNVHMDKPIDVSDLEPHAEILKSNRRVILDTGWADEKWGTVDYFTNGTYLTRNAAHYMANMKIDLLGMDFPNVDKRSETVNGMPAPNHVILLGTNMCLLENLLNLGEIEAESFNLTALPLRLIDGDGCPCRAIAQV